MTVAEQKLYLFRQIDQMPEELLLELENFVANLLNKTSTEKQSDANLMSLEQFLKLRIEAAEQGNVINKSVLEIFNEVHQEET